MPRFLLIDDNDDDRALVRREIRREHPDADIADVASRAEFDAALAGPPPDLTVVDYALGWGQGIELFGEIKAAHPNCPVIMFTGTLGEEHAVAAMKAGLDDYIIKDPLRLPRLRASMHAVLAQTQDRLARRRAEAARDVLLKEVFHRVHNSLQTVLGLLRMHAGRAKDPQTKEVLEDLGRRVHSLAMVQARLYQGESYRTIDFAAYLRELSAALASLGQQDRHVALRLDLAPLTVPVEIAAPLGLIANELITNAFEHAFLGRRAGTVHVALDVDSKAPGRIRLTVADDGNGIAMAPSEAGTTGGIGMYLIRGLGQQIGARIDIGPNGDRGTRAVVALDLAAAAGEATA
jgi:two-component sensor histidine kinase